MENTKQSRHKNQGRKRAVIKCGGGSECAYAGKTAYAHEVDSRRRKMKGEYKLKVTLL